MDWRHRLRKVAPWLAGLIGLVTLALLILMRTAPGHRAVSGITLLMALAVGVVAATGGLLSLARWNAVFGSRLELVATTIGIAWLVVFGIVRAARLVTRPALTTAATPESA